jgi:uncharacterized protein YndB with AHSA1/START domain
MDETVVVRRTMQASPEHVWAAVRAVGGLDRWFPVIETCTVTGEGVGAVRVLGLVGGGELHDRIDEVDDAARRLRYVRTVHPFPTRRYVGTVEVAAAPYGRTELTWSLDLDVEPADRDELLAFLSGAIGEGVAGLAGEMERA